MINYAIFTYDLRESLFQFTNNFYTKVVFKEVNGLLKLQNVSKQFDEK